MLKISLIGLLLAAASWNTTVAAADAPGAKILFLAGPRDHGAPGRHEYERDLRTLAQSLEKSSNLQGVKTQVFVGKAPLDLALMEDEASLVIASSQERVDNYAYHGRHNVITTTH